MTYSAVKRPPTRPGHWIAIGWVTVAVLAGVLWLTGGPAHASPATSGIWVTGRTTTSLTVAWTTSPAETYRLGWTETPAPSRQWRSAGFGYRPGDSPVTLTGLLAGHTYDVWVQPTSQAGPGFINHVITQTVAATIVTPIQTVLTGQVPLPQLNTAGDCRGVLLLTYDTQYLDGRRLIVRPDDGKVRAELSTTTGTWTRIPAVSAGESRLRWAGYGATRYRWTLARIIRTDGTGVISVPKLVTAGCPV